MILESETILNKGYSHLLTFEAGQGGYEWFGDDPGHEALTAYGLMQFHEMKDVISVDDGMINRVTEWVLSKRDGKGSFSLKSNGLDSFSSPPQHLSDSYILWVLTTLGQIGDLSREITKMIDLVTSEPDPYHTALAALTLQNEGRDDEADKLLKILSNQQDKDGCVKGSKTSITRSSGRSLDVETTALATLAFMNSTKYGAEADLGVEYIVSSV